MISRCPNLNITIDNLLNYCYALTNWSCLVVFACTESGHFNIVKVIPLVNRLQNWNEVESRVRKLVKSLNENLEIWTGSSNTLNSYNEVEYLTDKHNKQPISPYIWKVTSLKMYTYILNKMYCHFKHDRLVESNLEKYISLSHIAYVEVVLTLTYFII